MNTDTASYVLVGYDGSKHSEAALGWAAGVAGDRGVELVIAYSRPPLSEIPPLLTSFDAIEANFVAAGTALLARAKEHALQRFPGVVVRTVQTDSGPAALLAQLAGDAALVVVGTRGHGRAVSRVIGSVSVEVAASVPRPVVVVPLSAAKRPGHNPPGSVVVGVSSSPSGAAAQRFAAQEAVRRGVSLVLVRAWEMPQWLQESLLLGADATDAWRANERGILDDAVAQVTADYPGLVVTDVLAGAERGHALLGASKTADLLVIGSRRDHTRWSQGLGPVATGVLHRSACPVAVVGSADPVG